VVNVVTGYGPSTGAALTRHPLIRKIAFTGGAATARHVVRSSAENFAKLSLELGGKSPNIIFADADLDSAINGAVAGIYAASGQSCVAGSRLLVQDEIYDEFVERLVERARASASATRRTTQRNGPDGHRAATGGGRRPGGRCQGRRRAAAHRRQASGRPR
jgi:acyl-CoA reductase-like NAD-dependent aldehyde dehydrogenase